MTATDQPLAPRWASLYDLVKTTVAGALTSTQPAATARVAFAAAPTVTEPPAAQPPDPPASVISWLAQAALLYGMPFEYIVPDGRMLPKESLRFFYVDGNWLNSLVNGMVSIGLSSSADSIQIMSTIDALAEQAIRQTAAVRPALRGPAFAAKAADAVTTGPITGLLLRSAAVSGWPGMEVSAWSDDAGTQKLALLRMDRLSDDVMICLFDGLPRQVNFLQPPEGLHFGVRPPDTTSPTGYMSFLRGLGYGGFDPGIQIVGASAPITMRGGTAKKGVLDVATSAAVLKTAMMARKALDPRDTFTAAEFAVQMVRAAGMQSFQWTVPPTTAIERTDAP